MDFSQPDGLLAGYHVTSPVPGLPEIWHFGEQWAPRTYRIELHAHQTWELYLQLRGETEWEGLGRRHRIGPFGLLAVAPGVEHRLVRTPDPRHHFYFLAVDVSVVLSEFPDLLAAWTAGEILGSSEARTMVAPFQALARELTLDLPHRRVGASAALRHLIVEASRLIRMADRAPALFPLHPAVMQVRELIQAQPERNWSVHELAARACVSAAHLSDRFRAEVGVPPRQYLIQVRIERALALLAEGGQSISEIAFDLGFSSSQHLAATMKKRTGRSPKEHRAAARRG